MSRRKNPTVMDAQEANFQFDVNSGRITMAAHDVIGLPAGHVEMEAYPEDRLINYNPNTYANTVQQFPPATPTYTAPITKTARLPQSEVSTKYMGVRVKLIGELDEYYQSVPSDLHRVNIGVMTVNDGLIKKNPTLVILLEHLHEMATSIITGGGKVMDDQDFVDALHVFTDEFNRGNQRRSNAWNDHVHNPHHTGSQHKPKHETHKTGPKHSFQRRNGYPGPNPYGSTLYPYPTAWTPPHFHSKHHNRW